MNIDTSSRSVSLAPLVVLASLLWSAESSVAQEAEWPALTVTRGAEVPEAISMVAAYEGIVRAYLMGSQQRGTNFLAYEVRLGRNSAAELFSYAQEGWKRVIAMKLSEADAICSDREEIQSKAELAQRILSATQQEDALRLSVYEGAFTLLDEKKGERLRRYIAEYRAEMTTSARDIRASITESPESLSKMISNVCSYVDG